CLIHGVFYIQTVNNTLFFSNVHKTFTRIDYFLINNNLLPSVQSVTYNPIVISDHAPIPLTIGFDGPNSTRPPWRFNTRLLSSDVFVQSISNQINTFIEINKTPDISASTLWDILKAYLRGSIISYTAFERRTREAELSGLMQKIGQLDTIYAANPSPDLYKERLALQANFNICSTHKEEELLLRSRYKYYEQGDKAGRLLAHQLKQESSSHQILQIRTPLGMTPSPKQINDHFKDYYSTERCAVEEGRTDNGSACTTQLYVYYCFYCLFFLYTLHCRSYSMIDWHFWTFVRSEEHTS